MYFNFDGVTDAFYILGTFITDQIELCDTPRGELSRSSSRVGDIIRFKDPLTIKYYEPRRRVLFNEHRDANPFFHLYEALWMLAGRKDVQPLAFYNSKISDIASDDGVTFNGAYGYRWKTRNGVNQINRLILHLQEVPDSRRAVLQMWSVEDDLLRIESSKDVCCNLSVCFQIRNEDGTDRLNMTVFNRSNDLIWGALGANFVHFTFLQEYIANALDIPMGRYCQISNDMHFYLDNWKPGHWFQVSDEWAKAPKDDSGSPFKLVSDKQVFDSELIRFVEEFSSHVEVPSGYNEPFLSEVAVPMLLSYHFHKSRDYYSALNCIASVQDDNWRIVGEGWLERRHEMYKTRENK